MTSLTCLWWQAGAYGARLERVVTARAAVEQRLHKRLDLMDGYARVVNMIEIEVRQLTPGRVTGPHTWRMASRMATRSRADKGDAVLSAPRGICTAQPAPHSHHANAAAGTVSNAAETL